MTENSYIVPAALLCYIGQFLERTGEPLTPAAESYRREGHQGFEPFNAMLIDELPPAWNSIKSAMRRLVLNFHQPESADERLIYLAHLIAADGTSEGRNGAQNGEPALERILSRVEVKGRRADHPVNEPLIPFPLSGGLTHAASLVDKQPATLSSDSYRQLWDSFLDEIKALPFDLVTLLALLKKYTWAIPWGERTNRHSDVSLYAQSKATAAVAAALMADGVEEDRVQNLIAALAHDLKGKPAADLLDEPLFALVKGDVSGTQDFIYLLASSHAGRGLRGRSFFLQLLTETVAGRLLRHIGGMPLTNLLFAGGGHFYLLLPYKKAARQLQDIRLDISKKMWQAYRGDISIIIDSVSVSAREFKVAFGEKWGEVTTKVNQRKRQRLSDLDDETLGEFFKPIQLATTLETTCSICHGEWCKDRDRMDGDVRKCNRCEGFEDLGAKLRRPVSLVTFIVPDANEMDSADWKQVLRYFGTDVHLLEAGHPKPAGSADAESVTVSVLDSVEFISPEVPAKFRWDSIRSTYDFRFFPNATPYEGKYQVTEFDELANASAGVKWLGVLRMDVDNLGDIFKEGLKPYATIARTSTLSDSLRLFFEGWVPKLCREFNDHGNLGEVFLVYAGGDDLFVVGSWSALPELAKRIRDDFRAFVGGDHVSLSGGIAIEHQKYPLYQLAEDAKHALDDRAKEFTRNGKTKDALTFLQVVTGWEQFEPIADWKDKLIAMLKPQNGTGGLARGFLTRLGEIHYLYEENARRQSRLHRADEIKLEDMREQIRYAKWVWRLVYHLGRAKESYKEFGDEIERFKEQLIKHNLVERLNVIARWTELLTREVKE